MTEAERQFEIEASTMDRDQLYRRAQRQAGEIAQLQAAINETLRLADFLNQAAAQGAGFADHWGERVMQAVEPLRNVEAFAGKTLEHNRSLLDYNGELVERENKLQAEVARLSEDLTVYKELYEQEKEVYALSVKKENELQAEAEGAGETAPCRNAAHG
jgi:hypothetical protein